MALFEKRRGGIVAVLVALFVCALVVLQPTLTAQQEPGRPSPPRLTHKAEPEYTPEALKAGLEGTVVLGIEVGADGLAHDIRVLRGLDKGLDQKAVECVQLWKFEPGTRDGKPVAVRATVEMNFRLPGLPADRQKGSADED